MTLDGQKESFDIDRHSVSGYLGLQNRSDVPVCMRQFVACYRQVHNMGKL